MQVCLHRYLKSGLGRRRTGVTTTAAAAAALRRSRLSQPSPPPPELALFAPAWIPGGTSTSSCLDTPSTSYPQHHLHVRQDVYHSAPLTEFLRLLVLSRLLQRWCGAGSSGGGVVAMLMRSMESETRSSGRASSSPSAPTLLLLELTIKTAHEVLLRSCYHTPGIAEWLHHPTTRLPRRPQEEDNDNDGCGRRVSRYDVGGGGEIVQVMLHHNFNLLHRLSAQLLQIQAPSHGPRIAAAAGDPLSSQRRLACVFVDDCQLILGLRERQQRVHSHGPMSPSSLLAGRKTPLPLHLGAVLLSLLDVDDASARVLLSELMARMQRDFFEATRGSGSGNMSYLGSRRTTSPHPSLSFSSVSATFFSTVVKAILSNDCFFVSKVEVHAAAAASNSTPFLHRFLLTEVIPCIPRWASEDEQHADAFLTAFTKKVHWVPLLNKWCRVYTHHQQQGISDGGGGYALLACYDAILAAVPGVYSMVPVSFCIRLMGALMDAARQQQQQEEEELHTPNKAEDGYASEARPSSALEVSQEDPWASIRRIALHALSLSSSSSSPPLTLVWAVLCKAALTLPTSSTSSAAIRLLEAYELVAEAGYASSDGPSPLLTSSTSIPQLLRLCCDAVRNAERIRDAVAVVAGFARVVKAYPLQPLQHPSGGGADGSPWVSPTTALLREFLDRYGEPASQAVYQQHFHEAMDGERFGCCGLHTTTHTTAAGLSQRKGAEGELAGLTAAEQQETSSPAATAYHCFFCGMTVPPEQIFEIAAAPTASSCMGFVHCGVFQPAPVASTELRDCEWCGRAASFAAGCCANCHAPCFDAASIISGVRTCIIQRGRNYNDCYAWQCQHQVAAAPQEHPYGEEEESEPLRNKPLSPPSSSLTPCGHWNGSWSATCTQCGGYRRVHDKRRRAAPAVGRAGGGTTSATEGAAGHAPMMSVVLEEGEQQQQQHEKVEEVCDECGLSHSSFTCPLHHGTYHMSSSSSSSSPSSSSSFHLQHLFA